MNPLFVVAYWDHEVNRWWAVGPPEVPGIAAEADLLEDLVDNIKAAIADLRQDDPQTFQPYDTLRITFVRSDTLPLT